MKVKAPQLERALDTADPAFRLYFVYGPAESASRAQADRLGKACGADAERIDLDGAILKDDPARLADEVASYSMFASRRWVRVKAGDEALAAVEALLEAPASGTPVVLIAGDLKKTSALVKRLESDPAVLVCQNYFPGARDAGTLVMQIGHELGLRISADAAQQLLMLCADDQGVIRQELVKFALFLDAMPAATQELTPTTIDVLGADSDESDIGELVNAVMDGRMADVAHEGVTVSDDPVRVLNQLTARIVLLAKLRAEVASGISAEAAIERGARGLYFKEKPVVTRQVRRWPPSRLVTAHSRLLRVRQEVMASSARAAVLVGAELIAIARVAARLN
jgi:DNA polymerase-3 subunit delta